MVVAAYRCLIVLDLGQFWSTMTYQFPFLVLSSIVVSQFFSDASEKDEDKVKEVEVIM